MLVEREAYGERTAERRRQTAANSHLTSAPPSAVGRPLSLVKTSSEFWQQAQPIAIIDPVTDPNLSNTGDEVWMRLALEQAQRAAALGEVPIGAVAVLDGEVVGAGHNRKESDQDPTAHAEMLALRQAARALDNWRLIGVTLYCTVEPCPMCAGAMIQARLSRLVYGAPDTRFGADGSIVDVLREERFNHRVQVTTGVLQEEAAVLLRSFFRRLRENNNGNGSESA